MAKCPPLIVADAEFLAALPDFEAGSPVAKKVEELAVAGVLITTPEAKHTAEDGFQALSNFPAYRNIPVVEASRQRKALARTLAPSAPSTSLTRHKSFVELIVAAAAIEKSGDIITSDFRLPFYQGFLPPLECKAWPMSALADFS